MNTRQAGTMLHPGAQRSEHRTECPDAPIEAERPGKAAQRQSGRQLGAWSRHHPGASFPLAHRHYSDTVAVRANNLKPVSIIRG